MICSAAPDEESQAESPLCKRCREFCLHTTAHGYGHLTKGSIVSRICWAAILVLATIIAIFHIWALSAKYMAYEYHETISTRPNILPTFPDVTVCDTVRLSNYAWSKFEGTGDIFKQLYITDMALDLQKKNNSKIYPEKILNFLMDGIISSEFIFANIPSKYRNLIGTQFENFVVHCRFGEHDCGIENFETIISTRYLSCFTFKAKTIVTSGLLGAQQGLSLVLRGEIPLIRRYRVFQNTENTRSIHMRIHPRNTMPFLTSTGGDIIPGMSTAIELSQRDFTRLESPYTNCLPETNITDQSKEYLMEPNFCLFQCAMEKIRNRCNCISTQIGALASNPEEHCLYLDPNNIDVSRAMCEMGILLGNGMEKEMPDCKRCAWNCRETKYDFKMSQALWPEDSVVGDFVEKYILVLPIDNPVRQYYHLLIDALDVNATAKFQHYRNREKVKNWKMVARGQKSIDDIYKNLIFGLNITNITMDDVFNNMSLPLFIPESLLDCKSIEELQKKWVQESFYRLNVYFSEPFVTVHEQVASYCLEDFWSGIGGTIGLWTGASALTLLEVFAFITRLIFRKPGKYEVSQTESITLPHPTGQKGKE